ncbi:MAG: hypothetical protein ABI550_04510 [Ignavibacteriaceae bacterium]
MFKKSLWIILLLIIIIHVCYSFRQHLNIGLDGDMALLILPSEWYQKVFDDPFGMSVLLKNEIYAGPNRFFAHWIYSKYFKVLPGILQNVANPVDSVYIACAIAKTAVQVFIIMLLAFYISGKKNIFSMEFLLAAVLVCPFFITYQYYRLGIIDQAITFVFFYALPLALLLLFFLPFFKFFFFGEDINTNFIYRIYMVSLAIIISLSGAIIPGVVLIICPAVLLYMWYSHFKEQSSLPFTRRIFSSLEKIPKEVLFYFILVSALSIYSLYIGRNNIENSTVEISLSDRYALLPKGFIYLFNDMTLLRPLLAVVVVNLIIIRIYFNKNQGKKILNFSKWIGICSLIYILLLPLGGYREYRPYIIRYDTLMPVTLSLILLFGLTANYLILNLSGKFKIIFSVVITIFLVAYFYEDKPTVGENRCQRNALFEISESKEDIVLLKSDCTVMSWVIVKNYKESELNAELLKLWGVTKEKKLFYQK